MLKNLVAVTAVTIMALGTGAAMAQRDDDNRGSVGKKGAVLLFPKVELRWRDGFGGGAVDENVITSQDLIQDTFISLSNDGESATWVKMYLVQGDGPLAAQDNDDNGSVTPFTPNSPDERAHPGWNFVDFTGLLTRENPVYWSANSGLPGFTAGNTGPVTIWRVLDLDPGIDPGRPDPLGSDDRVLRGFIYLWATNMNEQPVFWNRLSGAATIVNYADGSAYEYLPYAFQAQGDPNQESPSVIADRNNDGQLDLNGQEYDYAADMLLLDFYADSFPGFAGIVPPVYNTALSGGGVTTNVDTELTLVPITVDFSDGGAGPLTVAAIFNIWNENESRLSFDQPYCITCFESQFLRDYFQQFQIDVLGTNRGKARIDSAPGILCPNGVTSVGSAIAGVATKFITFDPDGTAEVGHAASSLVGQLVDNDDANRLQTDGAYNVIAFGTPLGSGNIENPNPGTDPATQLDLNGKQAPRPVGIGFMGSR